MSRRPLEKFEALAQRLVEGSLQRLFGGRLDPIEISADLARAIEQQQSAGNAPNYFRIQLHPADYTYLRAQWPDIAEFLVQYVLQIARELNLGLATEPVIDIVASPDIARHFAHIDAQHVRPPEETTQPYQPQRSYDPLVALRQLDAFLIIDGRRHLPLVSPQVTLGRRSDCDIVLESRNVSRRHAQLRWRFGRFVLFDLGSRAGTRVNGELVSESTLRPGDVLQLADVALIYGEGLAESTGTHNAPEEQATRLQPRQADA